MSLKCNLPSTYLSELSSNYWITQKPEDSHILMNVDIYSHKPHEQPTNST